MILYTQPSCGICRGIHMFLDSKKIQYTECQDLDIMKSKGIQGTPVLELDDGRLLKAPEIRKYINEVK